VKEGEGSLLHSEVIVNKYFTLHGEGVKGFYEYCFWYKNRGKNRSNAKRKTAEN